MGLISPSVSVRPRNDTLVSPISHLDGLRVRLAFRIHSKNDGVQLSVVSNLVYEPGRHPNSCLGVA